MQDKLLDGVCRFQKDVFNRYATLFKKLESGQSPHTLFITCSDSRIDPSMVTQSDPGELFVIRNAGNIVPPYPDDGGDTATIEYAVEVLNVQRIVICGHSYCGAVQAVLNPSLAEKLPAVRTWLGHAEDLHTRINKTDTRDDPSIIEEVKANVRLQIQHLMTHPCVRRRAQRNELNVEGWVYAFQSGEVSVLASGEDAFRNITESV